MASSTTCSFFETASRSSGSVFDSSLHPDVEAQINGATVPDEEPLAGAVALDSRAFVVRIVLAVRPPTVQSSRHSMIAVARAWPDGPCRGASNWMRRCSSTPCASRSSPSWATDFDTPFRSNLHARLRAIAREAITDGPVAPGAHTLGKQPRSSLPTAPLEVDLLSARHRPAVQERHPACGGGSPPRGPGGRALKAKGDPSSDG